MAYNVDVENIANELDFDVEDIEMLLEVFLESSKESLEQMEDALNSNDLETLYQSAHGIKGSASNILLNNISDIAKDIELNAKKNIDMDYKGKVAELSNLINSIEC